MAKQRKKRMRLPNGIGSVHQINDGKRRRKPWRARVPSHIEFDEDTGKATQKYINLGYYETETEAIEALFEYRKNPYTIESATATFAEVFEMWKTKKYPSISRASQYSYNAAYKHSEQLHNMKMRDIRTMQLDRVMQTVVGGRQTQALIRTLWGQLFKYAIEHDIVQKNYAEFVSTRDKDEGTKRTAIPPEDIAKFWSAVDEGDESAEIVLIYIYTGFRLNELLEIKKVNVHLEKRIMIGGKKTAAGKDRHVPIHKCILPFIEKRMQTDGEWLFMISAASKEGNHRLTPTVFNASLSKILQRYKMERYTAHYMRHTFATIARQAGMEDDIRKLILGHSSKDITDRYTHITDDMLVAAMDMLPGRE